ncbi:hypothetical protein FKW77_008334 [Venturia effusa]|uniref:Uncharacterized protein n=1 Tax=Venturia effusa TaxID=50376 RepID=A0A517LKN7_9PEZI|nr:hypothetical protein FKW77_008334 [Venturia effusa]
MAPHPPKDAHIEQGQEGSLTEQQNHFEQLRVESVVPNDTGKPDTSKEKTDQKAARSDELPDLTMSVIARGRTAAWVETQIAPDPLSCIISSEGPSESSMSMGTDQNAEVPKDLVVGLPKTPAKETIASAKETTTSAKKTATPAKEITMPAKKASTPAKKPIIPAQKIPHGNSATVRSPFTFSHTGPRPRGPPYRSSDFAKAPVNVNAQWSYKSLEIEGERQFNLRCRGRLDEYDRPIPPPPRPLPMPGTPRGMFKVLKKQSGLDEEKADGETGSKM